ncbi:hypothetical protein PoB_003715200 [Plakobranchus ocellatus]|uniref:Uncharacterized protein n=1 Tax=Plakobranchus ocellatus TaxID=259542 RepID=A0AAV4AUH0_9GAST|nr:hypothetical protein PoB_003715200 [Plakobranchus ocellatus]
MLEVKPTSPCLSSSILMGHPVDTASNTGVGDGFIVASGRLNQAEVLNRLNGNYGDYRHFSGRSQTPRGDYRASPSSICQNYRRNIAHFHSREDVPVSAMRTWPSSPSPSSSPSSSLSSLSPSSPSPASSSSTLSSSEVDYDKENKNRKSNSRIGDTSCAYQSPCTLETAVRNAEASFYTLAHSTEYGSAATRNRSIHTQTSIANRFSSPCSEPSTPVFSRSPCREDNRVNRYARDSALRNAKKLMNNNALRSLSPRTKTSMKLNGNRSSPTRSKPYVGEMSNKCVSPAAGDSGLISPTSKAIADSLAERRACHDFAKYLISPSSMSPSSRSPGTPSSNHSSATPTPSTLYKRLPFSQSANALFTRPVNSPSPTYASCSSSPTLAGRLRSLGNNPMYHQYHGRRQQHRDRKFRLNLFMYSALYRKQRRTDSGYIIYHNPIEGMA